MALAGGPSAGIVSHRCSLSMCTCAVAALVERARVGPGCSMPVGPVVVARVGSCCARVGLCRASVADAVRGPLARMHCGCVFVRIRCEGQPQGRCLSRVSCVRRSAVLGADPACLSSPHIRHSIIYSERAAPRKGRSVRSQSPEGTENYRSYKTGAATLFSLTRAPVGAASSICSLFFTNGRLVGAIPTCSHVRCVGLSGDGPALVPRGRRVFLIPLSRPSCRLAFEAESRVGPCATRRGSYFTRMAQATHVVCWVPAVSHRCSR